MVLLDINVLVYAHREDAPNHVTYLNWLEALINSDETFALSELVLSAVIRIVTHPKIFNPPSPLEDALVLPRGNLPQEVEIKRHYTWR